MPKNAPKTRIQTVGSLSELHVSAEAFLLYDRKLTRRAAPFVQKFSQKLGVTAGEPLKDIDNFSPLVKNVLRRWKTLHRNSPLYVLGGGTLGDAGGFVASCLKRGVPLIHIPSTWLSAVDSAHGGKNAFNVLGQKNQIGSFYDAEKVFIARSLLAANSAALQEGALGEFLKMGLIAPAPLFEKMIQSRKSGQDWLWQFLKPAIREKYRWVTLDPRETKGQRQVLNLGHSFGHVLEAHLGLSHGQAVMQGIFFACAWSREKNWMSDRHYQNLVATLEDRFDQRPLVEQKGFRPLPSKTCQKLLAADKKSLGARQMQFVFLRSPGRPLVEKVSTDQCLAFAHAQGWVR